jgi:carbon storage regulator
MLVLTRRPGEAIVIGTTRLTVLGVIGGQVRIGIKAPLAVTVDRQEVHQGRAEQTRPRPRKPPGFVPQ